MKKSLLIVTLIVILMTGSLMSGCTPMLFNKNSGPVVTRDYDITDFTRVEAGFAFKVDITPSDTYSVAITTNESNFTYVDVYKSGDTLKIDMKGIFWPFGKLNVKAKITMPELRGLSLSGAAEGNAKGFKSSQDMDCAVSGASQLDMDMETGNFKCEISGASQVAGHLKATSSDIELSGASQIELDGSGGNIRLDASGGSHADLKDFAVEDADIELSGASEASIEVNGKLDVNLNGASTVWYSGNPTLGDFNVSGGSELKRR